MSDSPTAFRPIEAHVSFPQLEEKILLIEEKTSKLDDKTALMVEQAEEMFSDQRVYNRMKRMKVEID